MSKVDWSLAPDDATHYFDGDRLYAAHWLKTGFYLVTGFEKEGWREDHQPLPLSRCVERPKQPKPWSGPEDGLPPVGTTCEALNGLHDQWRTVLILDHEGSVPTAACRDEENRLWWSQEFRAIKTPEQLAAEKRETAIREFMDLVGIDCRVTASKAVDAGFKREWV